MQGPADVYGLRFEPPTLVARIAHEAGTDEALPLIAFAMRALWDNARDDGVIREMVFDAPFCSNGGIPRHCPHRGLDCRRRERKASRLPCAARSFGSCGSILHQKPVRRQAQWSDLPEAARPTLEKLVNARLLSLRGEGRRALHQRRTRIALPRLAASRGTEFRADHGFHGPGPEPPRCSAAGEA